MSISYDEIRLKYIEGKLLPGLDWIIKNLESDPEVVAGACQRKENLRKFLQGVADEFEEYLHAGDADPRDNQDDTQLFGDEDIVVAPNTSPDSTGIDFLNDKDDDSEEDDVNGFLKDGGHNFDNDNTENDSEALMNEPFSQFPKDYYFNVIVGNNGKVGIIITPIELWDKVHLIQSRQNPELETFLSSYHIDSIAPSCFISNIGESETRALLAGFGFIENVDVHV
jgi:hypothetical protein